MKNVMLLSLLGVGLMAAPSAYAQRVAFGVGIGVGPVYVGPAPVCPYGYYGYYPYACAPYGYYGPEWFVDGVFIGAGPWFHGWYGRRGWGYGGWGHGGYYSHSYYGHPGYYGRQGFRGVPMPRGPAFSGRGSFGGGYRGGFGGSARGGFHGGGHR